MPEGSEGINPYMHDYIHTHRYIYIQRRKGNNNPFMLWALFNNRPVSEWAILGNSGSNITLTKTYEGEMEITYRIPL